MYRDRRSFMSYINTYVGYGTKGMPPLYLKNMSAMSVALSNYYNVMTIMSYL